MAAAGVGAQPTIGDIVAELPARCAGRLVGDGSVRPTGLTHDSRAVGDGVMFACMRGEHHDGHDFARAAVDAGAPALLVDHELDVDGPQLVVDDVRACIGWVAAAIAGHPSRDLLTVGITGTSGKTSTVALLAAIFEAAGYPTGIIGTLSGAHTTPEAPELQERLAAFRREGKRSVVMEVSSHALQLHRATGTTFAAAVFTNLGEDHLDFHDSIESYFRAKAKLFEPALSRLGVVNADDPHGRLLIDAADIEMVPFHLADASDPVVTVSSLELTWRSTRLRVPIGGDFNIANVLAAATTAAALGVSKSTIATGLANVEPIPGRFELVTPPSDDPAFPQIVVDYSHKPDGLESVLGAARRLVEPRRGRVLVVFGCGGDRDTHKRPRMGEIASRMADVTVITSDNPRSEDPMAIIDAIVSGVKNPEPERVLVEPDRRAAIGSAIERARPDDIVVIAGKGHETYQVIGSDVLTFDDRVVAAEWLAASRGDHT